MKRSQSPLLVALLACAALLARGSSATPEFPAKIDTTLALSKSRAVDCTLCHADDTVTAGKTVTTLVGRWFYQNGLRAYQDDLLLALLKKNEQEGVDSDQDGVADMQEIRSGTDPNHYDPPEATDAGDAGPVVPPPSGSIAVPLLQTGCSFIGHDRKEPYGGLAVLLACAGLLSIRRRK